MTLNFCSFASGSSGNCYMVRCGDTALLVDAGISGKRIFEGLERTETPLEQVKGLLITHEHIDHVKSIPIVTKKRPRSGHTQMPPHGQILSAKSRKKRRRCLRREKIFQLAESVSDRLRFLMTRRSR